MKLCLPFLLLVGACSLDGLTGGVGGTSAQGAGGHDSGTTSAFTWVMSIGNDLVQGTSPYATDAGSGSSLRASEPGPDGDVWIAIAAEGAIDPDGAGGFDALGNSASFNLFLLHVGADGQLLGFRAFNGDFAEIEYPLAVGAVIRLPDDALAIIGLLKGGSLDLGAVGTVAQPIPPDDGYVIRLDADGTPTHARRFGGPNGDLLRAGAVQEGNLVVTGKFKGVLQVENPAGVPDVACTYDEPTEPYDRSVVAVLDAGTLECSSIVTFGAIDVGATQQPHAIALDASGVYVAGTFWRQIVVPGFSAIPAASNEDGFVVALGADLSQPSVRWVARLTSNRFGADESLRGLALSGGSLWIGGFQERGTGAVMDEEPSLGIVDMTAANDCVLPLADGRDAVVGRLELATGACEAAIVLGAAEEDEVRGLVPFEDGVIATGFTTLGIDGLDGSVAAGSRDGFFARLGGMNGVELLSGGRLLGGLSWDYLDAARPVGGAIVVGGSYDVAFDVLEGRADFFIGKMKMP